MASVFRMVSGGLAESFRSCGYRGRCGECIDESINFFASSLFGYRDKQRLVGGITERFSEPGKSSQGGAEIEASSGSPVNELV